MSEILRQWSEEVKESETAHEEGSRRFKRSPQILFDLASSKYRIRRLRERYFQGGIFGEPAWDILLELFANHAKGSQISVTSLCIAANVPTTTALRYISLLEDRGLVTRSKAGHDRRVSFVKLSEHGHEAMTSYLMHISGEIEELLSKQLSR